MKHVVLALDLATTTGWALHRPGMERPFFGAERLPGKPIDVGRPAERLRQILAEKHELYGGLTDIIFEAQHIGSVMDKRTGKMRNISIDTIYRLIALGGIVEWFAHCVGARCYKVHIQEWRKHFLGRGTGFKGRDPKDIAIDRCAALGWHTDVADAAEACGILDFYLHLLKRAVPEYPIPWRDRELFGGACG